MPRLEDSLQIVINDAPEPLPDTKSASGGSDMPDGKPIQKDPMIEKFMDDDIPLEDSLPAIDEPEFVMKPPPKDEDLFEEQVDLPKKVNTMITQEEIMPMDAEFKKRTPTGKLKKPKGVNSNGKKRKPMSEEHKVKLAVAREKALVKRRANAKQRQDDRDKKNPPKEPLPEVPLPEVPEAPRAPTPVKQSSITKADLEEISLKTVIAMETMRKRRKEEKKKKQAENQYKSEVMDTIRKANPSWMETSGIYANCY